MSLVRALGSRFLAYLAYYTRGVVARAGTGPVVLAALAAAALVYSWRQRKENPNADRRRRTAVGFRPGSSTSRRLREQKKLKVLAGVQKVTIGAEPGTLPGSIFEFMQRTAQASAEVDGKSNCSKNIVDEIEAVYIPNPQLAKAGVSANGKDPAKDLVLKADIVKSLHNFASLFDLYLIVRVDSDEEEKNVTKALREGLLFKHGLDPRKVIFCETSAGRVSIVRQIEPDLHIDETASVISGLQKFVKFVAFVSPSAKSSAGPSGSNVLNYSTLGKFFELPPPKP